MKNSDNKAWLLLLVLIGFPFLIYLAYNYVLRTGSSLPYYGVSEGEGEYKVVEYDLLTQDSISFTNADVEGKLQVVNFFFTVCPTICPSMMRNLLTVEHEFEKEKDFIILSHTVDPVRDTPSKLKRYGEKLGINEDKWVLLTGTKKDLYYMARSGYFVTAIEGPGGGDEDFIHSELLILVDQQGHIRGYYEGTDEKSVKKLINDIRLLL